MTSLVHRLARSRAAPYAAALVAVLIATATRDAFEDFFADNTYTPYFFATLFVTVFAGPGPGALATMLSALSAVYIFLPPSHSFSIVLPEDVFQTGLFICVGLLVSGVAAWIRRGQRAKLEAELARARFLLREEANESLQQSEQRYRSLFETSRDGIVTADKEGRIQEANAAYCEMLGYTMDELRAINRGDLTPPAWRDFENRILKERVLAGEDSGEYEKEYVRKDGRVFPVSVRAWPVEDASGKVVGMRALVRDITERKRAEDALRAADRRKDEFLATLAHELRNPLTPIRNAVYLLREDVGVPDKKQRALDQLAMIDRQVDHLLRFVDDLFDVSRLAFSDIELKKARVDLVDILRQARESARPRIAAGRHDLLWKLPDAPVFIDGDFTRLAQVFAGLLDNAAKYTAPEGVISLVAEIEKEFAVVTVRDSGAGVPPDMLPLIFERFTQVDRALGRSHGGAGIGLALGRSVVELHGGSIEAHSEGSGCGAAFIVRLPLSRTEPRHAAAARPSKAAARRALVVDDEPDIADSLALLLEELGATAAAAYSGAAALERVRMFKPEIVFLNLAMPHMDGYATARGIRALPEGRETTLVALTGSEKRAVAEKLDAAGFDACLTKPAGREELQAALAIVRGN